jgi:hypothetical protein
MADINAQAGQVLGVAQPPVANNQPRDFSNIKLLANQLDQLNNKQEALVSGLGSLNQGLAKEQGAIAQGKQQQAEREAQGQTEAVNRQYQQQQAAQQEYKQLLEHNPLPAFVPTKDSGMDLAKLMSSMAVMGTLMGRSGGGQSAINAMASMKGMMEGWQQGRQDLYKKESDEFTKNYNRMLKIHGEFRQEMEDAIKLASTDKERAIAQAHEAAVKLHSPIVMHQVNEGNFKAAIESVKAMDKLVADMKKTVGKQLADAQKRENDLERDRIKAEAIAGRYQRRDYYVTPTGDFWDPATQGPPPPGSTRPPTAIKPGKPQADDASATVYSFTGASLPLKEATTVVSSANALAGAAAIKEIVKNHPEWVGRTGQVKNFFNRTLESINLDQPLPDDAGQPELVFAKRYAEYLVNYERSLAGGARGFTVFFQQRFNKLLEQNQFNAEGMAGLMKEQSRTIIFSAAQVSPKITDKNLTEMARDLAERSGDQDAVAGLGPSTGVRFNRPTQGAAKPSAAPAAAPKEFTTLNEVESAAARGLIKPGDTVIVNGKTGTYRQ